MVKSTPVKPSTTASPKTKSATTATPAKKTPASTKTPEKTTTKPVTKDLPKPLEEKPVKPVKEVAKAIDTQVMKEKQEKEAEKDVSNALKANGNKPAANAPGKKAEKDITFAWTPEGAEKVQITGSFNDWQEKLDMKHVGDKHELAIPLKPGKYTYKFIVDGEWCYDFTAPNECDPEGNVNNVITV